MNKKLNYPGNFSFNISQYIPKQNLISFTKHDQDQKWSISGSSSQNVFNDNLNTNIFYTTSVMFVWCPIWEYFSQFEMSALPVKDWTIQVHAVTLGLSFVVSSEGLPHYNLMALFDKQGGWGWVVPLSRRALFLTLPFSVHRVNMTMFRMFCSHTILQKSSRVEGRGPWVTTYSLLDVNP